MVGNEATIVGVMLFVATCFFAMWQVNKKQQREDADEMKKQLAALRADVTELSVKIQPFWMSIQTSIGKALTRDSHERVDELIVKLLSEKITSEERDELVEALNHAINDTSIAEPFRNAARFMLNVMTYTVGEARGDFEPGEPSRQLLKGAVDELTKR
jgi:hypothetical protein